MNKNTGLDKILNQRMFGGLDTFERAYEKVKRSKGSRTPGMDGRKIGHFSRLELSRIQSKLRDGTYRPSRPYWIEIPKPADPSKKRKIAILNIGDRIVQTAIHQTIAAHFLSLIHI